jgi:hypothetical protein
MLLVQAAQEAQVVGTVNWLAVLVATLSAFAVGFLWYGPVLGRTWMRASGMTEEQARQGNMPLVFGLAFVLQLVATTVLANFIAGDATVLFGLLAGGAVGLFLIAPALGIVYLFERRPLAHWLVNAGYHVVTFAVIGAILGAF